MEKDKLKLSLLERIISCEDAHLLKKLEQVISESSEIQEVGERYITEADPVPASHYEILEEEFQKYKKGEIEGIFWEQVRQEIKSTYGF